MKMREMLDLLSPLRLDEAAPPAHDEAADEAIIRDMMSRADMEAFREWALENGADEDDLATEHGVINEFTYWLEQEHSIRVPDGMVEFWTLYGADTERMIGDNPIALYHFTSSARLPSIRKEGLVAGKRSVNRTKTPGVYLTTETSGPAINGYIRGALRNTRSAHGVRLTIRTTLSEIEPDPDDADISSGAHQFVTSYVAPSQIVGVDRA